ncbi:MAG TPA: WYL domain-containing protein [Acidimicrobiales bacterium]|jgi:proteasome accessory factor B|nr:WYL domain-containing protein [Acidimicrobiales bacterium]
MDRLERLINLTAALLDAERPLTADELHQRLPGYADSVQAFRRAFERDKDVLREMGVPLVLEPVDPMSQPGVEGYRIPKDEYYLHDPGLDPDELAALHLAASAVELEGADGVEALWKLGGWVAEGGPPPAMAALPGAVHLSTAFAAISRRQPVTFTYRGGERRVDPWRLAFRNGHWYLLGRDHDRNAERNFRLDRVESDIVPDEAAPSFEPPPDASAPAAPWQMGDEEPVRARLLVDADHAGWAVGQVGQDAVERREDDGSVVLGVTVTNRSAFRSFVLGFLDHAEVLDPPELRDDLISWLEELCGA